MNIPIHLCKRCGTHMELSQDGFCHRCRFTENSHGQTTTDPLAIEIAKLSHQIQELKFSVDRLARSIDRSKSIGHAMEMRLLGDEKE